MSREKESANKGLKRQKNQALFQLQLNKCSDIPQKEKLLIKVHLVECRAQIIRIFEGFNAYKCYKRLQEQLKDYLESLRGQELPLPIKSTNKKPEDMKSPPSLKIITRQMRQSSSSSNYFPRMGSLVLDVGLLIQQSQLRNALSPCNMKSKRSNDDNLRTAATARTVSKQRHLTKVYSTNRIQAEGYKNCQKYVEPFCQQQLQHSNTKLFLMNKIKHQKHFKNVKKPVEVPQQNAQMHGNQESIFSFEIYSKKDQENLHANEAKPWARQTKGERQPNKNWQEEGIFYKRIREVIDSQYS